MTKAIRVPVSKLTDNELHILIAEEAGEIVQCATKIMRFGVAGHNPEKPSTYNWQNLRDEFLDLEELMLEFAARADAPLRPKSLVNKSRLVFRDES